MQFFILVPMVLNVSFGYNALGFFFAFENDLTFPDITGCINAKAGNGIALHSKRFHVPLVPGNTFLDYMSQKSFVTNTIILQHEISRPFVPIFIKYRACKIDLKEINLVPIIYTKVQPRIPNT